MDPAQMPASLSEAIATEPMWLQAWLAVLVTVNLAAVLFVVRRRAGGGLAVRPEPIAILLAFAAAGIFMEWLYVRVGYVRLLGIAHLVFWGPVYGWVLSRRRSIGTRSLFGKYVHAYLVVAGISLAIDLVDLIRHLAGDGELLHRWR